MEPLVENAALAEYRNYVRRANNHKKRRDPDNRNNERKRNACVEEDGWYPFDEPEFEVGMHYESADKSGERIFDEGVFQRHIPIHQGGEWRITFYEFQRNGEEPHYLEHDDLRCFRKKEVIPMNINVPNAAPAAGGRRRRRARTKRRRSGKKVESRRRCK